MKKDTTTAPAKRRFIVAGLIDWPSTFWFSSNRKVEISLVLACCKCEAKQAFIDEYADSIVGGAGGVVVREIE